MTINQPIPGRPPEIEELANRLWVHPASRALVDRLVLTKVTPNQISFASVAGAMAASVCFVSLPPLWGATMGGAALFLWHVLDGADGDLARRTGRATASGELVDGICDHTSQALIYVSLAMVLQRSMGWWAWPVALASALSHAVQANAYEAGRKTYRHWVYGAPWMRQRPDTSRSFAGRLNILYLGAASIFSPGERLVDQVMENALARGGETSHEARKQYKAIQVGLVKRSGLLGSTGRSLAVICSLCAGTPLWLFLYEIFVLNGAMAFFVAWRRRANIKVFNTLGGLGAELQLS